MKAIFFLLMFAGCFLIQAAEKAPDGAEAPAEADVVVKVKITPPEDVRYKKGKKIPNLIITANYRSSVILAEIARQEKGVPYILLPALGEEKGKIHFIPARKKDIFPVPAKELGRFIAFLAPERILVLGDDLMVPRTFRPLSTRETPCINISSSNWKFNSLTLGNFLLIEDMPQLYEKACSDKVEDPLTKGFGRNEEKKEQKAEETAQQKK